MNTALSINDKVSSHISIIITGQVYYIKKVILWVKLLSQVATQTPLVPLMVP